MSGAATPETFTIPCPEEAGKSICGLCETLQTSGTLSAGSTTIYTVKATCTVCKNGWTVTNRPITFTEDSAATPATTNPALLDFSVGCSTPTPQVQESNNTVAIVIMIVVAVYVVATVAGLIIYFIRKKKAADANFETPEQIALRKMKEAVIAAGGDPNGQNGAVMAMGAKQGIDTSAMQNIVSPERTRGSGHVNYDANQNPQMVSEFPAQMVSAQGAAKQLKRRVAKKPAPVPAQ